MTTTRPLCPSQSLGSRDWDIPGGGGTRNIHQHIEAETKWPPLARQHFQVHFLEWKLTNFKWNFTEICSLGSDWQYGSIGWDTDAWVGCIISGSDNSKAPKSHYLNEWWSRLLTHICVTLPQWVNLEPLKYGLILWGGHIMYFTLLCPSDINNLGQHWFRSWLVAWWHQAITWTNVDLPRMITWLSSSIHSRVMFTWILKISIPKLCLKFTHLKSHANALEIPQSCTKPSI